MGLGMYLHARKYVGNWEHCSAKERKTYATITNAVGMKGYSCPSAASLYVELAAAYWRKANQIHKWFVDNVQNGEDNCQAYGVRRTQLQELLELCQQVKKSKDISMLPPEEGFFFGGTDVENNEDDAEWYWMQIDETINQLQAVLKKFTDESGWYFEYRASW